MPGFGHFPANAQKTGAPSGMPIAARRRAGYTGNCLGGSAGKETGEMKPQKAVWVETGHIAIGTGILTAIMAAVFAIVGRFDWMVLLGASIGFVTAVGNFFFMAYTVQKVTHGLDAEEKDAMKQAKARMKMSYSKRLCAMMVIIGVSIKVLGANWIACMAPLLFPRVTIMAMQLLTKMKAKGSEY